MYEIVHIDEKSFYLTKVQLTVFLTAHKEVKIKRFITKVMFLVVYVRPGYNYRRRIKLDRKSGNGPF